MNKFRVDLDVYNGPLDLLLFLIRREEVDIYDIPIARITGQYLGYVRLIESMDPNLAGEFLVMASTLMEIKSRTLLPRAPVEEGEEEPLDPRMELVRQLLEYKTYKDAARDLGAAAEMQALKYPRHPVLPPESAEEVDLEEVGIWDLLEAFNKLLEQTGRRSATHDVVHDDTPIALHAADIMDSLERSGGTQPFERVFEGRSKSEMIGLFLALLELIRQRRVRAEQDSSFGRIVLHMLDAETEPASAPEEEAADATAAQTPKEEQPSANAAPFEPTSPTPAPDEAAGDGEDANPEADNTGEKTEDDQQ